jgi:polar amino acid transport system substrate-binding protein
MPNSAARLGRRHDGQLTAENITRRSAMQKFRQRLASHDHSAPPSPAVAHFTAWPLLLGLALAISFCLPAQAVESKQKPLAEITIASEGARPPYNYLDNNQLAGFEIDLGQALCARMGVKCNFIAQNWDDLIPGLIEHHYDAIMAAMEITPDREAKIAFSLPYVRMPSAFMVGRASELTQASPETLTDKKIGVEAGGPHQTYLEDLYKNSEITPYATLEDAVLDLAEGRVDAVLGDKDAVVTFLETRKEGACCRLLADVAHDPAYFGAGIGIGLRKEDQALKAMFDKAIAALDADGTFTTIRAKYFNFHIK